MAVTRTVDLNEEHFRFAARKDYYVGTFPGGVGIFDRKTLKRRKIIKVPGATGALALRPKSRVAFVAVYDDDGGRRNPLAAMRVARVDETTGEVKMLPRVLGNWLAVDANGQHLFTAIKLTYRAGYEIDWHFGDIQPHYGDIDVLVSFDLVEGGARHLHTNLAPGVNGRALRISADGLLVSYVPQYGYHPRAGRKAPTAIPAFEARDIRRAIATYEMGGAPLDLSYHPYLDLAVGCTEKEVRVFDRRTGKRLEDKLDLAGKRITAIRRVLFSPGGMHVLIDCRDELNERAIRTFRLRLTAAERTILEGAGIRASTSGR
jgi:hypothetical protein